MKRTKFLNLTASNPKGKVTVFTKCLGEDGKHLFPSLQPCDWDNVMHIGYSSKYGDVFKCWDEDSEKFLLFFGEKGDEFD